MERIPSYPLTDDELHALVDDQGRPEHQAALRARLASDPAGQARLAQWQTQRDDLHSLYRDVLSEPVPASLLQSTQRALTVRATSRQWWRYGGIAASLVLTFTAGWFANTSWVGNAVSPPSGVVMARLQMERDFVRQASLAHSVYVPEVRHPVEVSALEQAHLVQWLSKRLGKPLKVPDLAAQGFELVGGRLLPGEAGARAQFMFQNNAGNRITLYLGAVAAVGQLSTNETSFKFEPQAGVPSFYWVDQGFGYALAGQVPRDALMRLAEAVYQQLQTS